MSRRSYDYGRRFVPSGKLDPANVSSQEHTCFVCGKTIPAGTPHQIRSMCTFTACSTCDYPREKGNYQ